MAASPVNHIAERKVGGAARQGYPDKFSSQFPHYNG